ncbi:MAG TPA: slipin family protein [Steroidobacteraceae bacterium]|nr:slipin family protein [Steroidobacteraceae bacterium]
MFQIPLIVITVFILALLVNAIKILKEYERGVIFTLGRFTGIKGPGLIIVIPVIQQMSRVDLRTIVLDVPKQDVISRDNVSVKVNAVVYFRIVDPAKAIIQVANPFEATSQLAQTTLRSVLGQHELDEMLSQREKLNSDVQKILDDSTDIWGIKVSHVEIKHVDLDESMIRAMAQQAEAERSRRAKVIHAEGEKQAAAALVEAARELGADPRAIQLRYLQTLSGLSASGTTTIVFPLPMDLITPLLRRESVASKESG